MDATKPTDQELISAIPAYIRETRAAVNAVIAEESDVAITTLTISAGTTALVIGTTLLAVAIEVVKLNSLGAADIAQIRGGTEGQIKIFIFQGNNMTFADGAKALGALYLNQLPVGSLLAAQQDDVLALVNIGGNGSTEYGYWKELWRQISVK